MDTKVLWLVKPVKSKVGHYDQNWNCKTRNTSSYGTIIRQLTAGEKTEQEQNTAIYLVQTESGRVVENEVNLIFFTIAS